VIVRGASSLVKFNVHGTFFLPLSPLDELLGPIESYAPLTQPYLTRGEGAHLGTV
jgi:hypothetical protein